MREIYEFAEFLACSWRLGNPGVPMPIADGRLDMALEAGLDALPERFHGVLSFGNTRTGYRCYEMTDVLHAAYANLLVTAPTPAHTTVDIVIDEPVASILLRRRGIAAGDAAAFAKSLRERMASF
ncbi:hypothetical protein [Rhizobium sp. BK176]|uniref:hypothetical protein n=1 Tax=Rhizobium sp. BK176 TaxID=2587071 RepID=UPI002168A5C8|nr:hypothetical protein [Rhizobium sp. BK176]MCS4088945.1 hypothetical protein [Rhizobium sp. BK176]